MGINTSSYDANLLKSFLTLLLSNDDDPESENVAGEDPATTSIEKALEEFCDVHHAVKRLLSLTWDLEKADEYLTDVQNGVEDFSDSIARWLETTMQPKEESEEN